MKTQNSRDSRILKDEINLIEYPVTLPCHRQPKGRKTIHIVEETKDPQASRREWIVKAGMSGLPLAIDEEVLMGLLYLLNLSGLIERHVYFTQYRLLKILGWSTGSTEYNRLKQSLDRLRGAIVESKNTFWDHGRKCRVSNSFNILDNYTLYEREAANVNDHPFISSVSFNEFLFESFRAGFIKNLDLDMYLSLKLPIARKLFRFLDKQAYHSDSFKVDLKRLANRLALTDSAYPSDIQRHLASSHKELLSCGFLKSASFIRCGQSPGVRYVMAPKSEWYPKQQQPKPLESSSMHPLVRELVDRGVSTEVARDLVNIFGEKKVADKLEVFDYLRSESSALISKNPAGFLRQSIERDFAPPTGYISRVERQRLKLERQQKTEKEREVQAEKARIASERKARVEALWASLSETNRERLEAEALTRLSPFAKNLYNKEKTAGRVASGHHNFHAELDSLLAETYLETAPTSN